VQQDPFLGDEAADVVETSVAVQRVDEAIEALDELTGTQLGESTGTGSTLDEQLVTFEVRDGGHEARGYA
jgi:hypothetical protein